MRDEREKDPGGGTELEIHSSVRRPAACKDFGSVRSMVPGGETEKDGGAVSARVDESRPRMTEETGKTVLTLLRRQSRALRIPPEDREDVVQDVAIWIAHHREAGRPITESWLRSTLVQFARSVSRAQRRETPLDDLRAHAEPTRPPRRPSASTEELTRNLGEREKKVVDLLLEGHTWESALHRIGIRHGSQSRWRSRIRRGIATVFGRGLEE
jgi:DNA-directed RNA polymerase specialized sigma24 family protein